VLPFLNSTYSEINPTNTHGTTIDETRPRQKRPSKKNSTKKQNKKVENKRPNRTDE